MGILTLLRNAFGRSRKAKEAPAPGAAPTPETSAEAAPAPAPDTTTDTPTGTAPSVATGTTAQPAEPTPETPAPPAPAPVTGTVTEPTLPSQPTPPSAPSSSSSSSSPSSPSSPSSSSPASAPTAQIPDPRSGSAAPEEHELVVAAFDKVTVTVPKPARALDQEGTDKAGTGSAAGKDETAETETPAEAQARREAPTGAEAHGETQTEAAAKAADETVVRVTVEDETVVEVQVKAEAEIEVKAAAEDETVVEVQVKDQPDAETRKPTETEIRPDTEAPTEETAPAPAPQPESDPASAASTASTASTQEPHPEPAPEPKQKPEAARPRSARTRPAPGDETRAGDTAGTASPSDGEAQPGKPAVSAARVRSRAPHLSPAYKAAGAALRKHGLTGARAKVYLVLDRSASMRPYYQDGSAQALAEQTLALAAHLDPEATVPVVFFSTELDGTGELTLTDHQDKITELHGALGRMGRTSYHAAVAEVIAAHEQTAPGSPALVVFQTDGAPDAKTPATRSLTAAAADHPSVFFSFVAFGDPENKAFDYLRKLKTGNASHFLAGETPRELTDKEMYEGLLASWRP